MGPLPSIGSPRVFTTLPNIPSPTLIDAIVPVLLTEDPSLRFPEGPRSTAPTLSSSRLSTMPFTPFSNSTSSPDCTLDNP